MDTVMQDAAALKAAEQSGETHRATNSATQRVLDVLSLFALEQATFGVTELARRLGITKNMAHRALSTLVEQDLLLHDPDTGRYGLGLGILRLQNPNFSAPDFRAMAAPSLRRLFERTSMTSQLSIPVGDNQVVIDGVEATGRFAIRPKIGTFMPLHASAASRAILAAMPDGEIESYLRRNSPLPRFTETTLVMPDDIWAEVRVVRTRGYALSIGDYSRGGAGCSFAIQGGDGFPHGAITVGGPARRVSQAAVEASLPVMLTIIADLRRQCRLYDAR